MKLMQTRAVHTVNQKSYVLVVVEVKRITEPIKYSQKNQRNQVLRSELVGFMFAAWPNEIRFHTGERVDEEEKKRIQKKEN